MALLVLRGEMADVRRERGEVDGEEEVDEVEEEEEEEEDVVEEEEVEVER